MLTLEDFSIDSLQNVGPVNFPTFLNGPTSQTVETYGCLMQTGTVNNDNRTVKLYFVQDFVGTWNNNTVSGEDGFLVVEQYSESAALPVFFIQTTGNYSGISTQTKNRVIDFWYLITQGEIFRGVFDDEFNSDPIDIDIDTDPYDEEGKTQEYVEEVVEQLGDEVIQVEVVDFPNDIQKSVSLIRKGELKNAVLNISYEVRVENTTTSTIESSKSYNSQLKGETAFDNEVQRLQNKVIELTTKQDDDGISEDEMSSEIVTEIWEKSTKWLLTNSESPITSRLGPNGDKRWLSEGEVLELNDVDFGGKDSGSVYFKCPENMTIFLKFGTESNSVSNELENIFPDEWTSSGYNNDEKEKYLAGVQSGGVTKFFQVTMNTGDRLSIDVDKEDPQITQFKLVVDGEVYELSQGADSKIDDEVYINISNPQITYLRYTDGSKGGNIFDGEGNKKKNKDFEESKEPPFEWKWYHTTGLILLGTAVFVGILLWRRSSPKVAVVENVQPQRVVMQR